MNRNVLRFFSIFLIFNTYHAMPRLKRAIGTFDVKLWNNATIPYIVDDSFSGSDLEVLQRSINTYQSETCLKFENYKSNIHSNWLKIENGETCFSQIGLQDTGEQSLILSRACRQYGLILHEMAHTIGLIHEMMRPDRNQYIRYFLENIQDEAKAGFEIESNHYKLFDTPFDFQSIMMYSPYEYSKNGFPVWLKMNETDGTPIFDIREKDISFWDAKAINDLYQCGKHCSITNCSSGNFVDKNCVCQTPEEFARRRCIDDLNHTEYCRNASQTNICYNKPVSSSTLCRKTCGKCFRYGSYGLSSPPPYKCVDHDEVRCKRNKNDGFCFIDTWTKVYCKKSCKTCLNGSDPSKIEFVCKDRHNPDLCEEWARNGQCSINPGFMKAKCALSCKACISNTTVTKPKAPCRNYSPDSYCDAMAAENKCYGTTLKICLGSCGKCGSNYERNEANLTEKEVAKKHEFQTPIECKETNTNCEYFASQGHCQTQKTAMKFHCPKTCNFCMDSECKNEDTEEVCDSVKERGLCTTHVDYANRCQKTCQICKTTNEKMSVECKDQDSSYICKDVLQQSQCISERGQRCQYTCNLCNATSAYYSEKKTTLTRSENEASVTCVNENDNELCENLKKSGGCQSNLSQAAKCRKTCSLCTLLTTTSIPQTECKNAEDDENCISWASSGYCNENTEYMKENCAKACKFCNGTGTKPVTSSDCENKESSGNCNSWVESGYCRDYPDYMKINCPKSCGFCNRMSTVSSSSVMTTKKSEVCKNIESDELCESWSQHYCSVSHIAELCLKTCNQCQ